MRPFSADTDPAAHAVLVSLLRQRSPAERIAMVKRVRDAADAMAMARLRRQYPEDDERTRRLRLAALHYDDALLVAAFGWDPAKEGR